MTTIDTDAEVQLDGVANFRDFGGARTRDGRVRLGRLYRSAHLAECTPADRARLRALGLRTVIDLRRLGEREREPSALDPDAVSIIACGGENADMAIPPHLQAFRAVERIDEETARAYMLPTYERVPFEERHVDVFSRGLKAIAGGEAPALVHCAAGKDRTGVFCALVLFSLGVERDDVFADYLATNDEANIQGVMAQALARLKLRLGRDVGVDEIRAFVGVEAAYLNRAISAMEDGAGSIEAYVRDVLGVTTAEIDAMRVHLIEPE